MRPPPVQGESRLEKVSTGSGSVKKKEWVRLAPQSLGNDLKVIEVDPLRVSGVLSPSQPQRKSSKGSSEPTPDRAKVGASGHDSLTGLT